MLTDLLSEKEDLFKRNKKELNELKKSATNPLIKEQREIETQITNKTKEILNQEKLVKKLNSELESFKSELKKLLGKKRDCLKLHQRRSQGRKSLQKKQSNSSMPRLFSCRKESRTSMPI